MDYLSAFEVDHLSVEQKRPPTDVIAGIFAESDEETDDDLPIPTNMLAQTRIDGSESEDENEHHRHGEGTGTSGELQRTGSRLSPNGSQGDPDLGPTAPSPTNSLFAEDDGDASLPYCPPDESVTENIQKLFDLPLPSCAVDPGKPKIFENIPKGYKKKVPKAKSKPGARSNPVHRRSAGSALTVTSSRR
eukprot:GFYU01005552.1.p1 GENE.GFYU01005552.1~~GFYU01005552.1.p1  ORF type:complete len:190 (-),score=54.27 GFYU01005552.1:250-819(-)